MTIYHSEQEQDTLRGKIFIVRDTLSTNSDTVTVRLSSDSVSVVTHRDTSSTVAKPKQKDSRISNNAIAVKQSVSELADSTSVCMRNSISDVTYYDSINVLKDLKAETFNSFPYLFLEEARQIKAKERLAVIKSLKQGEELPLQTLHNDWIIGIIIAAALLFSYAGISSTRFLNFFGRFFLFRGINTTSYRDADSIFSWQSTIQNLISFLVIALFFFCAASYYNLSPFGIKGILLWLIILGIVIAAVTLRHIVCLLTGNIASENESFREYIFAVYQFYRYSALFLFVPVILMLYANIFPMNFLLTAGLIILGFMYLIRVTRLIIIFINRKISIFYLILYLCALEILPVLISVKYFTGLI